MILFFFIDPAPTEIYTLSLHDALPICLLRSLLVRDAGLLCHQPADDGTERSEEHTSELQSHSDLVCRLLLEKKKLSLPVLMVRCTMPSGPSATGQCLPPVILHPTYT